MKKTTRRKSKKSSIKGQNTGLAQNTAPPQNTVSKAQGAVRTLDFSYGVLSMVFALVVAWLVLMPFDFLYGLFHDVAGIREGIEQYAPLNRYREGFELTDRAQRLELFHQISLSVHNSGKGLADIVYVTQAKAEPQLLLREPEVQHLQDVAQLIDWLKPVVLVAVLAWLILTVKFFRRREGFPALRHQVLGLGVFALTIVLVLGVVGAEKVFNTLHEWIFPGDHQWFFYYQDSLMSTMMLAPVLFAWIAGALAIIAVTVYVLLNFGLQRMQSRYGTRLTKR
ncbi:MAG: DUF1461 domain-containing protein [Alteromonadaceae bacterium]|nr:MAG: DUF1461 domain-containing protein [Alteromonadaceae bacterium]